MTRRTRLNKGEIVADTGPHPVITSRPPTNNNHAGNHTMVKEEVRASTGKGAPKARLVESPSSIASLAVKEREALDRGEVMTTVELTNAFETAVRDSGVFSWIGVVLSVEMSERPMVDVYLSERTIGMDIESTEETVADVVDLFDDLALSLEPNSSATLHLIRDVELPREKLEQEIRKLCTTSEAHSLLWQEPL